MAGVVVLEPSAYQRMAWRNGGGSTTEIARHPDVASSGGGFDFHWRISIADVKASGPFSPFSGYRRLIAVIEGAGMRLSIAAAPAVEVRPGAPALAFSGDDSVDCALIDGAIRDFNLIFDPRRCQGQMDLLGGGDRLTFDQATVFVHLVAGRGSVETMGQAVILTPGMTARVNGQAGTAVIEPGGRAVVVRIAEPLYPA